MATPSKGVRVNPTGSLKRSMASFREKLAELLAVGKFTPSTWLLHRLNDNRKVNGKPLVSDGDKDKIALGLVQYELPRLAAIEAEVTPAGIRSHEDWLAELENETAEGKTMQ